MWKINTDELGVGVGGGKKGKGMSSCCLSDKKDSATKGRGNPTERQAGTAGRS